MKLRTALISATVAGLAVCAPALGAPQPGNQTLVCLATGSASHPWVEISPSVNGAYNGLMRGGNVLPRFTYQGADYELVWSGTGPTPPASCLIGPIDSYQEGF
jgi:hypothetical protein